MKQANIGHSRIPHGRIVAEGGCCQPWGRVSCAAPIRWSGGFLDLNRSRSILGSNSSRASILDYLLRSHYNSLVSCSPRILLFPSLFDLGERKEIATAGLPFAGHYPVIVSPLLSSPLVSLYYHQGSLSFLSFFLSFSGRSR